MGSRLGSRRRKTGDSLISISCGTESGTGEQNRQYTQCSQKQWQHGGAALQQLISISCGTVSSTAYIHSEICSGKYMGLLAAVLERQSARGKVPRSRPSASPPLTLRWMGMSASLMSAPVVYHPTTSCCGKVCLSADSSRGKRAMQGGEKIQAGRRGAQGGGGTPRCPRRLQ